MFKNVMCFNLLRKKNPKTLSFKKSELQTARGWTNMGKSITRLPASYPLPLTSATGHFQRQNMRLARPLV